MREIVPVVGYEKQYMVSDDGIVFRVTARGLRKVEPIEDQHGYYRLSLSKGNEKKKALVHRIVAEAFIPNVGNLPCVNHKDENKKNNCVDNLEWCTHKYNTNYNNMNYRRMESRRKPVIAIGNGNVLYFESITAASKALKINHANILAVINGKRKSAGGMIFALQKG